MPLLKNPFAIRDGKVIVIDDLYEDVRESVDDCYCPYCGGGLKAESHCFIHKNKPCDEKQAFINGLYGLYNQFLCDGNQINAPTVSLYCDLGRVECITEYDYKKYFSLDDSDNSNYTLCVGQEYRIKPDRSSIKYDIGCISKIILAEKRDKKLKLIINYLPISKRIGDITQDDEIPYLIVSIPNISRCKQINTLLFYRIFNDKRAYSWDIDSLILSKLPEINVENRIMYKDGKRILDVRKESYKKQINEKDDVDETDYRDYDGYSYRKLPVQRNNTKIELQLFEEKSKKQLADEKRWIESEIIRKETEKRIKSKKEQRNKKLLPLKNYMKKYYADNKLGKPNLDNTFELYNFTAKFPDAENTLGRLEAELCIEKGMPPIDHWEHIWMTCRKCGTLYKTVPEKNDEIPTIFVGICDKCKGKID